MASSLIVVIPTAGRPDLLRRTLESLSHCRKPSIFRKTLVIENGTRAGAEDIAKAYQASLATQYFYEPLGNKSHALNTVLEMARDSLIYFTDDDVRIHPETLCAYAEAATGVEGGQFYGGPTGVDYEQPPPAWLKTYLPSSAIGLSLGSGPENIIQEKLQPFLGFNWAAFGNDLLCLGGFNTDVGPGSAIKSTGQESDMHIRLFDYGVQQVYIPNAMVWHFIPRIRCSRQWTLQRAYRRGVSSGYFDTKPGRRVWGIRTWLLVTWLKLLGKFIRTTLNSDSKVHFDARFNLAKTSGRIWGAWKSPHHPSLTLSKND